MFSALLRILPAVRWPTGGGQDVNSIQREPIAVDVCVAVIQTYFPCSTIAPINNTCFCEQSLRRLQCYSNHASTPSSHPDYAIEVSRMNGYCYASGAFDPLVPQENYHLEARQFNSLLQSLGGEVGSYLSSQSIPIPTAVPPAVISAARSILATSQTASSASTPSSTTSATSPSSTLATTTSSQSSAQSSAQPTTSAAAAASTSTHRKVPIGAIIGAAVGGVAVLLLAGILLMLILRHRKRKRTLSEAEVPALAAHTRRGDDEKSFEDVEAAVAADPHNHTHVPPEKVTYGHHEPTWSNRGSEMETSANVWELENHERPVYEMESPHPDRAAKRFSWENTARPITPAAPMDPGLVSPVTPVNYGLVSPVSPVQHEGRLGRDELFMGNRSRPGTAL